MRGYAMVKIGIVGGGFSGLAVAYFLREHDVTIIESGNALGGLASWIDVPGWEWPIEKFVHHWFVTDKWIFQLIRELGLERKMIIRDTRSSCYYKGEIAELDSAVSLLKFPLLRLLDRLRMGAILALLRLDRNYLKYEKITAYSFLKKTMGKKAFEIVWEPLLIGKFGRDAEKINAAWFWGRVHPRTKSLAYIEGGFKTFIETLSKKIRDNKGKVILNTQIKKITKKWGKFMVDAGNKKFKFDYLVLAVPLHVALELYSFPKEYKEKYKPIRSIGAQYFILALKKQFLDEIYWLNINDKNAPFVVIVEHTHLVDKKHYGDKHIIWVGKYLDYDDPLWKLSEAELLEKIISYLKKINPEFKREWINKSYFTRSKNAQPLMTINYSRHIPKIETPIKNLYLANMNQIYPWDRGTNNAVGIGLDIAKKIEADLKRNKVYRRV